MFQHVISEAVSTIETIKPDSLVYCTEEFVPAMEVLRERGCSVSHVSNIEEFPRFELGIVFDFLEQRTSEAGIQFLCKLRNLKCEKIWVAVTTSETWNLTGMISLGFVLENRYVKEGVELCTYSYDIATYNRKREWNNARFWANPENWGKYRW